MMDRARQAPLLKLSVQVPFTARRRTAPLRARAYGAVAAVGAGGGT